MLEWMPPGWHDVSIGECESCGSIVVLEIEMVKCIDLEMIERLKWYIDQRVWIIYMYYLFGNSGTL